MRADGGKGGAEDVEPRDAFFWAWGCQANTQESIAIRQVLRVMLLVGGGGEREIYARTPCIGL